MPRAWPIFNSPSQSVPPKVGRLALAGQRLGIDLHVRRSFCPATDCPRKTGAERLPELAAAAARPTARLPQAQQLIGQALGGEAGARPATPLGMPTSPDTPLRRVRQAPLPKRQAGRGLGVDDGAWRPGPRSGTIRGDRERHRPVDLLPDQGADRWHRLLNSREALMRVADRHHAHVSEAAKAVAAHQESERPAVETPPVEPAAQRPSPSRAAAPSPPRRGRRRERYHRVLELHEQGVSLRGIARRLGMHRATVRHWLHAGTFPERARPRVASRTDPFSDSPRRRWDEGCRNAARLTREIQTRGFRGPSVRVRRRVAWWRPGGPGPGRSRGREPTLKRPSARRISWWLRAEQAEREPEEQGSLEALWDRCPERKASAQPARAVAGMGRQRRSGGWDGWRAQVQAPGVARERRGSAVGLRQGGTAVKAALSLEWSNGPVEGRTNRLKTLPRPRYGRAGFDLLRRRFLQAG